jgi:hypothetical protein
MVLLFSFGEVMTGTKRQALQGLIAFATAILFLGDGCRIGAAQNVDAVQLVNASVTTLAGRLGITSPFSDGVGTMSTFYWPVGIVLNAIATIALVVSAVLQVREFEVVECLAHHLCVPSLAPSHGCAGRCS